jgi:effector-binding domain-containing protein
MISEPRILNTTAQATAVIRLTIPMKDMVTHMDPAVQELLKVLREQGITITGAMFSYHFRRPTETFDFEVGFPVDREVRPSGRVKPSSLPARRVARTVYSGPYEGLASGWGELGGWMREQGVSAAEDLWEQYQVGPEKGSDATKWRTELTSPLIG